MSSKPKTVAKNKKAGSNKPEKTELNGVSNNIELDVFCKNNPNLSSGDFKPGFQMPELSTLHKNKNY